MRKLFISIVLVCATLALQARPTYQQMTQKEANALSRQAEFKMPKVTVPSFGKKTYNVLDYGADPTGIELSTKAIQDAIDRCNAQGGGTVIIPAGMYTTGPITLRSNVRLYT